MDESEKDDKSELEHLCIVHLMVALFCKETGISIIDVHKACKLFEENGGLKDV